ncbi:MAG: integration host factor subunit beta [Candidatus Omnitrophica bacterium]|nr:integration host factor subunit beta [Candidatus Omnitrophota bacterium]MCM8802806.1 integration host factor subunit beta [Candidatus Omnitrophota bacterium]
MVKKDIVERISEETGLNKTIVKTVIEEFLNLIKESFENKERIELRGFGVFYFKKMKSKKARNPKTGEEVIIPERMKIYFKPSKMIRER